MQWFHEHRGYFSLIQFAATDERSAGAARAAHEVAIADTVRHIKDAIVRGPHRRRGPEMLAHAIIGVIDELTRAYILDRDEPVERAADAAVAFCLDGLVGEAR